MKPWLRIGLYLGSGGLLLHWLEPEGRLAGFALVLLCIGAAAALDSWLEGRGWWRQVPGNVVSLAQVRRNKQHLGARQAAEGPGKARPLPRTLYTSTQAGEAEELLELLRTQGLSPLLVSRRGASGNEHLLFEVRVPAGEVNRAQPVIRFFMMRSGRNPS